MSLVVGQNSWSTVEEADTYLANRIGTSDWFDLSDTATPGVNSKEVMLTSAFYWLSGSPQVSLSASLTDANVKNAQIESAIYLQEHYTEMDNRRAAISQGVTDFRLSKRQESFDINSIVLPQHILGLINDYSTAGGKIILLRGEYDG